VRAGEGRYLPSVQVAASSSQLCSRGCEYCLGRRNKLHFHAGTAAHTLGVTPARGALPFYPYSRKYALIRIVALTEGVAQIPRRLRGAWRRFADWPRCLDFSLETHPCRRLKGAEPLFNCAALSVFPMSPKGQTDPFWLPAEVAEWVILLLSVSRG